MTNIRRYYRPGAVVFLTLACHEHQPLLATVDMKDLLLAVLREVKVEQPFAMLAWVILNDHLHLLIRPEAEDFSRLVHAIKTRFAHRRKAALGLDGPSPARQRRFWDHLIRDEGDLARHLDYIHYNPVHHRYVERTEDYRWSSFAEFRARNIYPTGWADSSAPARIKGMELE